MRLPQQILVTGGAGFLGSHLCAMLLEQGHSVICLDNFYTGRKKNIEKFLKHPDFKLIEHDVCDPINIEIDQIYHLACPASPVHYQADPVKTTKTSVLGAINILELAKRKHAKVLFSSTSEIYGDPLVNPQPESYWGNVNSIGIRSCYDEGKRVAETFFMDYHRQYNVDTKIVRIFNTYGPNMCPQDGRVVSNFINQALENKPITIYGQGQQTRSLCFVEDTALGLIAMMDNNDYRLPINIGNPVEMTILEIANTIIELSDSKSELVYQDLPADDPKQRCPDITTAKNILDWEPKVKLETGLKETIKYFQQYSKQTSNPVKDLA